MGIIQDPIQCIYKTVNWKKKRLYRTLTPKIFFLLYYILGQNKLFFWECDMQFITLLALCQLCCMALPAVKMCDNPDYVINRNYIQINCEAVIEVNCLISFSSIAVKINPEGMVRIFTHEEPGSFETLGSQFSLSWKPMRTFVFVSPWILVRTSTHGNNPRYTSVIHELCLLGFPYS